MDENDISFNIHRLTPASSAIFEKNPYMIFTLYIPHNIEHIDADLLVKNSSANNWNRFYFYWPLLYQWDKSRRYEKIGQWFPACQQVKW